MGDKKKKGLKKECCEKYRKKGEHKRCKRCPCSDLPKAVREQRWETLGLELSADKSTKS